MLMGSRGPRQAFPAGSWWAVRSWDVPRAVGSEKVLEGFQRGCQSLSVFWKFPLVVGGERSFGKARGHPVAVVVLVSSRQWL